MLGAGYSSRLNQEVRIKRGLTYGAKADMDTLLDSGDFEASTSNQFLVYTERAVPEGTTLETTNRALSEMADALAAIEHRPAARGAQVGRVARREDGRGCRGRERASRLRSSPAPSR